MCEHICKTCRGHEDGGCLKGLCINNIKGECEEWFPSKCPVTGMTFSGLVLDEDGSKTPVYSFDPYTSYTIPDYDEEYKEFTRRKFDEDEGCWDDGCETLCELEELKEDVSEEKFTAIKEFYNIKEQPKLKDTLELKIQGIKCDNPNCDFKDMTVKVEGYDKWLNKSCPKCGAILLTKADMRTTKILMGVVKIANKILPKRKDDGKVVEAELKMNGTGKVDFEVKENKKE